jgi:hypothetical protein
VKYCLQWIVFWAWFLMRSLFQYLMNGNSDCGNASIEDGNISKLINFYLSILFVLAIFITRTDLIHPLYRVIQKSLWERGLRELKEIIYQFIDIYLDMLSFTRTALVHYCNLLFKHFGKYSNRDLLKSVLTAEITSFSNLKFFLSSSFFKYLNTKKSDGVKSEE